MDDVDHLVRFSETADSPPRRLLIQFDTPDKKFAVVLLNETFPELLSYTKWFAGKRFEARGRFLVADGSEIPNLSKLTMDETDDMLSSFTLVTNGTELAFPLRVIPKNPGQQAPTWTTLGLVITGKEYLDQKVRQAYALPKNTPTPFVEDKFGDSWNDSFYKEPRVIERYPETVIKAIESLLDCGRTLFARGDYDTAARKFKKAFHYVHSYYPEDLEEPWLSKLAQLKMATLQNLALSCLKIKAWDQALEAANFVIDMPEATDDPKIRAKALYRRALARQGLGDDVLALDDFSASYQLIRDPQTAQSIKMCERAAMQRNSQLRMSLSSAFARP